MSGCCLLVNHIKQNEHESDALPFNFIMFIRCLLYSQRLEILLALDIYVALAL